MMGLTALFGGTFNPFHIGHEKMLESLCNMPEIEEVWVMPDRIPPHKICDFLASDSERIEMCRIMADDYSKASVCTVEFDRDKKSYTYDTVIELKKRFPDRDFIFVCGADMIATLDTWYNASALFGEISFLAFNRAEDSEFYPNVEKMRKKGAKITVSKAEIPAVSSSELRVALKNREKGDLLPEKILKFIVEKDLYV